MAPTKPAASEATPTPLWKKIAAVLPGLAIFGTFAASAVAMKIAPVMGLLPGETNKELIKAWTKFSALPQLEVVLKLLKLDAKKFMITVAIAHLIAAALLVFPSGKYGAKLAGLWAMVAMAGAEFCTRQTAHVPAGFSKEFQWLGVLITSATHIFLFFCGAYVLISSDKGSLVVKLNALLAHFKKPKKESTDEARGRSTPSSPVKNKNRDSTPKPKKASGKPSSPPSSRGRGK